MIYSFQDYLREQPDNVKSFNIIAEVTRFLNVVYSNITAKSIELVIQLFDTMNEFTAVNIFFIFFNFVTLFVLFELGLYTSKVKQKFL